jgi:ethanolamine utilization protein EutN
MQPAKVIGHATATVKHASMKGAKLLIVQSYLTDGKTPDGYPFIAVDELGAGIGDHVMMTNDSKRIAAMTKSETSPVRWSVMGLLD